MFGRTKELGGRTRELGLLLSILALLGAVPSAGKELAPFGQKQGVHTALDDFAGAASGAAQQPSKRAAAERGQPWPAHCPLQRAAQLVRSPPLRLRLKVPVAKSKEVGNLLMLYAAMRGIATANGDTSVPTLRQKLTQSGAKGMVRFAKQGKCANHALHVLMNEGGGFCCAAKGGSGELGFLVGREQAFGMFDERIARLSASTTRVSMHGYFQSWKYWCHEAEELRAELRSLFLECLDAQATFARLVGLHQRNGGTGGAAALRGGYVVGVHVRLGDYLTAGRGRFGAVIKGYKAFLASAFAWFERAHPGATFIVFCGRHKGCAVKGTCDHEKDEQGGDDMCTGLLPKAQRGRAVLSDGLGAGEDMALLLSCDGAIATAGSYGWWGAFLTGGDVVAYGEPYSGGLLRKWSQNDFFPPHWHLFGASGQRLVHPAPSA
jgi:hypothetical protein